MISAAAMCLALNIYFEARDQSTQGQIAVAEVTLNRVASDKWPNTICGVVKQSGKNGCAFSWYCDKNSNTPKEKETFGKSIILAEILINNDVSVVGDKATYYHNDSITPYWAKKFYVIKKIGNHIFYSEDLWIKSPVKRPENFDKMICEYNKNNTYISNGIDSCVSKNMSGETKKFISD